MKITRLEIGTIAVLVVAFALLGSTFMLRPSPPYEGPTAPVAAVTHITLSIDSLSEKKALEVPHGTTLLGALADLNTKDATLKLVTKDYTGLGTLVTSMHDRTNGTGNAYWQYKVNGVMPQAGASQYVLQEGDQVEWYFAASDQ